MGQTLEIVINSYQSRPAWVCLLSLGQNSYKIDLCSIICLNLFTHIYCILFHNKHLNRVLLKHQMLPQCDGVFTSRLLRVHNKSVLHQYCSHNKVALIQGYWLIQHCFYFKRNCCFISRFIWRANVIIFVRRIRSLKIYQRGNQNPQVEEEQTTQWQNKIYKRTNNDEQKIHIKLKISCIVCWGNIKQDVACYVVLRIPLLVHF